MTHINCNDLKCFERLRESTKSCIRKILTNNSKLLYASQIECSSMCKLQVIQAMKFLSAHEFGQMLYYTHQKKYVYKFKKGTFKQLLAIGLLPAKLTILGLSASRYQGIQRRESSLLNYKFHCETVTLMENQGKIYISDILLDLIFNKCT